MIIASKRLLHTYVKILTFTHSSSIKKAMLPECDQQHVILLVFFVRNYLLATCFSYSGDKL